MPVIPNPPRPPRTPAQAPAQAAPAAPAQAPIPPGPTTPETPAAKAPPPPPRVAAPLRTAPDPLGAMQQLERHPRGKERLQSPKITLDTAIQRVSLYTGGQDVLAIRAHVEALRSKISELEEKNKELTEINQRLMEQLHDYASTPGPSHGAPSVPVSSDGIEEKSEP